MIAKKPIWNSKLVEIWNSGRKIDARSSLYTTSEVAEIIGVKNANEVRKLIEKGILDGKPIDGKSGYGRRSYLVVCHKALVRYIEEHGNIGARKWLVRYKTEAVKRTIAKESGQSGVLSVFKGLPEGLLAMVANLDPLDSLNGTSEDRRRLVIIRKLADAVDCHVKLRQILAKDRQNN